MPSHGLEHWRRLCEQALPHPGHADLELAGRTVADFFLKDFADLGERSVGRTAGCAEMEALLREPPPEAGMPFTEAWQSFLTKVAAYSFRPGHPRFLAFIPSAPTYYSVLGDWLCAGLNYFAGVWKEAPSAAQVELVVLDWFKEFLGLPATAQGILTGGGSEANLTALVVARERLPWEHRAKARLYTSEHRHWSVDRAAKVIGLHADQVRRLAADADYRLTPSSLRDAIRQDQEAGLVPWLVVANAGTTNTGTVDPLDAIAEVCRESGLWLHADAAYGWPAVLIPEGKSELHGIELADSVTLDPHKWFGQTFEAGCVLVRDGRLLEETFRMRPEYMQDVTPDAGEVNFCDRSIALTRRFRALKIWLSIKTLGVAWYRRLIQHCCALAEFGQKLLEQTPGFEILCGRQLSIVCFRYVPAKLQNETEEALNRFNLALCAELTKTGRAFLSTTLLNDRVALRFCFVNWRTTAADVEEIVKLLQRLGDELATRFRYS
ncbi:MAG: aminotransferase class V-fold PLP-dependent enzyme [Gemmataceae bacterium]|nr:aminotransferase class V-fold PLP-dependent enzyme [Gemmataceae bacterium]